MLAHRIALAVALSLLVAACGDDGGSNEVATPWVGTWRLSSQDCTGVGSLVITGIARTTLILGETKGTTAVDYSNGCSVRMEDYLITPVAGGKFEFPTSTSERVTCDTAPSCTGESTTTIDGVPFTDTATCPDDFPPVVGGLSPGSVEGNFINASVDLGQGVVCTSTYAKES